MLKTRVITAIVLLAVLLPSLFWLPAQGWSLLVAVAAAAGAWEWGGLTGYTPRGRLALGGGMLLLCVAIVFSGLQAQLALPLYALSLLLWGVLVPLWLRRQWPLRACGAAPALLLGVVLLLPTWLALSSLREHLGAIGLLLLMAVVWIADIAAYFFGRNFGRHKLAPSVSPGKTWEGAAGAVATVLVYGLLLRQYSAPLASLSIPLFAALMIVLTAVSIIGDLFESLLKRQAGLKDSSNLLPGHGGVLDRIDSLTSTLPLIALLLLL
jgi:phosphatidate cytidylyltransferase